MKHELNHIRYDPEYPSVPKNQPDNEDGLLGLDGHGTVGSHRE